MKWVPIPPHLLSDPTVQFLMNSRKSGLELAMDANKTLRRYVAEHDPGSAQTMLQSLTPTQAKVLDFIVKQYREAGSSPTSSEIKEKMGWSSNNSAVMSINALIKKGYIQKQRGKWRSLIPVFNSKRKKI